MLKLTLMCLTAGLAGISLIPVARAQAPAAAVQAPTGTITALDKDARTLTLKTDNGQEYSVHIEANARFRRVAPGQTDLKSAETIALDDLNTGDRAITQGKMDGSTLAATLVVVMSRADVNKVQQAEQADWDKRGVNGLVASVDAESVTLNLRVGNAIKQIVVIPTKDAAIKRYSPDSINFSDAKPSTLAEIKKGDQVRARGDKNADGTRMNAVEVVAGTFKTIAAQIISIDAAANEIRVKDLDAKTQVTLKLVKESKLQKVQPQVAQMVAVRLHPELANQDGRGGRGRGGDGGGGGANFAGGNFGGGDGGGRGGDGGGRGNRGGGWGNDIQQALDRSPTVTLADLKAGDAIVISSTVGSAADKLNVITLMAGVEPILTKPGTQQMNLGSWGGAAGGGGGGEP